jgi:hypothetical protein
MQSKYNSSNLRQQFSNDASKESQWVREIVLARTARVARHNTRLMTENNYQSTSKSNVDTHEITSCSTISSPLVIEPLHPQGSIHEFDSMDTLSGLNELDQRITNEHNPPESHALACPPENIIHLTDTHPHPFSPSPHSNRTSTISLDHGRIDTALRIANFTIPSSANPSSNRDSISSYVCDHGTIQQTLGAYLQVTNPDTLPVSTIPMTSYPVREESNAVLRLVNALPEVDALPDTTRVSRLGPEFSRQARHAWIETDDDRDETVNGGRQVTVWHRSVSARVLRPYKSGLEKAQEYIDGTLDQYDMYQETLFKRFRRMLGRKESDAR